MNYSIVHTAKQARALGEILWGLEAFAYDSETESKDWRRDRICWMQFSDGKQAWLVDASRVDPKAFKGIFEEPSITKVIHNSPFDGSWLKVEHGILLRGIYDTMHAEQVLLGGGPDWNGLKKAEKEALKPTWSVALEYCLARRGWPSKFEFEPFTYGEPMSEGQKEYSVRDVEFLLELKGDQTKRLNDLGLDAVLELENLVSPVLIQLMANGFGVDASAWKAYGQANAEEYQGIQDQLQAFAAINWQAPGQACKYFGVRLIAELEALGLDTPAYHLWRRGRDIYKNVTTYGVKWAQTHVMSDGRVRCQYNQIKNTGRLSADSPNLQQIPARTRHREFFVPSYFPGGSFIIPDFKSQELAIMAAGSQEPSWLQTLRAQGDVHAVCAEMVLGQEWRKASIERRKALRQDVKEINFGIPYGMTLQGYCEKTGHSQERAEALFHTHAKAFPKLHRWLRDGGAFCQKHGVSYSFPPFSRRRVPVNEPDWRLRNIGKNNPVQATGADMMKLAMVLLDRKLSEFSYERAIFVLQLHDELVLEAHPQWVDWVEGQVRWAMTEACRRVLGEALSLPEIRVSKNWTK